MTAFPCVNVDRGSSPPLIAKLRSGRLARGGSLAGARMPFNNPAARSTTCRNTSVYFRGLE